MRRRISLLLPLALAVSFFLCSVTSFAANDTHVNTRFPVTLSVTNSCNGELVEFIGELHVNSWVKNNRDGSTSYYAEINWSDAQGVGLKTGAKYVFGSNSQSVTVVPAGTSVNIYSQRQSSKLISAGAGPNQRFTLIIESDQNGVTTLYDFEIRCTGD